MKAFSCISSVLLLIIIKPHLIASFNFDIQHSILIKGDEPSSFFGYSVAFYKSTDVKRLLVGAPNTTGRYRSEGAVFHCDRKGNAFSCDEIAVDFSADRKWLGVSVISTKGTILACAPLSGKTFNGRCYYSEGSFKQLNSYIPVEENDSSMCSVGFSAALSQEATRFYTGAPSCRKNVGRLFVTTGPEGSSEILSTDGLYFGYALATGKVLNNGKEGLVASVGFHEKSNFAGKVVIVDSLEEDEVVVKRSITGYQPGEMFGASLAVSDLNGDKRDDIIIGAPYHSDYSANDITFESGAVYVYYKNSVGEYRRGSPHEFVLRGKANAGRFGYSLAALGDIDGDGFNDLAIGAPYQGAGTVYVYLGSRNGLRSTASQVINGKQFTPEIRSFGFAMAAQDFDGCLAVGAFQSDAVVYLPSKPVVRLFAELEFTPGNITFEERHCKLLSDDVTPCSEMRYCLKYSGQRVPQNIDVQVSIKLDSHRDMNQRLFFLRTGKYEMNKSLRLKFQETKCWEEKVVIKSTLRDVSSPIHVNLVSSLITRPNDLAPVLDVNSANGSVFETLFVTGLNNSQLCTQNLQLIINKNINFYIQGSGEQLNVDAEIRNSGGDDVKSEFYLVAPPPMRFVMIDKKWTNQTIFCYHSNIGASSLLRCDVSNELKVGSSAHLRAIFEVEPEEFENLIAFSASANGSNSEILGCSASNTVNETIPVRANASISALGWSRPEVVLLKGGEPGHLAQYFQVQNLGPSHVLATEFQISIQSEPNSRYRFHRLNALPEVVEGSASCKDFSSNSSLIEQIAIQCSTGRLNTTSGRIVVKVSVHISPDGIPKNVSLDLIRLVSVIEARVTKLPYDQESVNIRTSHRLILEVEFDDTSEETSPLMHHLKATPAWVFVISTFAALFVLTPITAVCRKCGFFRRHGSFTPVQIEKVLAEEHPLQQMSTEQQ